MDETSIFLVGASGWGLVARKTSHVIRWLDLPALTPPSQPPVTPLERRHWRLNQSLGAKDLINHAFVWSIPRHHPHPQQWTVFGELPGSWTQAPWRKNNPEGAWKLALFPYLLLILALFISSTVLFLCNFFRKLLIAIKTFLWVLWASLICSLKSNKDVFRGLSLYRVPQRWRRWTLMVGLENSLMALWVAWHYVQVDSDRTESNDRTFGWHLLENTYLVHKEVAPTYLVLACCWVTWHQETHWPSTSHGSFPRMVLDK